MEYPPARVLFRVLEDSLGKNSLKYIDYENDNTAYLENDIWITEIPLKCSLPTIGRFIEKIKSMYSYFIKEDLILVSVGMDGGIPSILIVYRWNENSSW